MVKAWRETDCLKKANWSRIKAFSSTGECSNAADMRWLSEFGGGKPVIEYCGGTEIGGAYITSTLVQANLPSLFSSAALGSGLILLDEDGNEADEGEMYLVPPAMGLSRRVINRDHHEVYYAGTPTLAGKILRRHGDQMLRLSNGYYQAQGRADDTMNLGGIKVGTAEIERVVSDLPGILELAAIAVSPSGGGPSQLVIYVSPHGGGETMEPAAIKDSMQEAIKKRLNPLFRIHDVVVIDRLPRTASNKIMRRVLRDDWLTVADR